MTVQQEILEKYSHINAVDLSDISKYFEGLSDQLSARYWAYVKDNLDDKFPTVAKIRKLIGEEFKDNRNLVDMMGLALKCADCKMVYANKRDRYAGCIHCPRCGSTYAQIIPDCRNDIITWAQDSCFDCDAYRSQERQHYGPECPSYGTGNREPECQDCKCRQCCLSHSVKAEQAKSTPEERKAQQEKTDWRKILERNRKEFRKYKG